MAGLLRSFMYCQSTLILLHKTADRSSIYWSQCMSQKSWITVFYRGLVLASQCGLVVRGEAEDEAEMEDKTLK